MSPCSYSDAEDLVELCVMCHAHSLPAAEQLAELSGRELVEVRVRLAPRRG